MKTRTLLLLSVGTALAILLAGGVLLFQLSNENSTAAAADIGDVVRIGDVSITVLGAAPTSIGGATSEPDVLGVDVEIGGLDDPDGLDTIRLVTGDRSLAPLTAAADGRCGSIMIESQRCRLDFDVSGSQTSTRVLIMRRGDEQVNWPLSAT